MARRVSFGFNSTSDFPSIHMSLEMCDIQFRVTETDIQLR